MAKEFDPLEDLTADPEDEAFSLEEILAEYGISREQRLLAELDQAETPLPESAPDGLVQPETAPQRELPSNLETTETEAPPPLSTKDTADPEDEESVSKPEELLPPEELPAPPRPVSVERAVGMTVDGVMKEQEAQPEKKPRRGLFSRKKFEETEQLYQPPAPEPEPVEEPIGEEEPLEEAAAAARAAWRRQKKPLPIAALLLVLLAIPPAAEYAGYATPIWTGNPMVQTGVSIIFLILECILCRSVFARGARLLRRRQLSADFLASAAALAAGVDGVIRLLSTTRSDTATYALTACAGLVFALWGDASTQQGRYDLYRAASMDNSPPYLVTDLERGACKQAGRIPGFYTAAERDSAAVQWQTALLPVFFVASIIFAGLGSLGRDRGADFLLNWSAILCAASSLALPLAEALPASRLALRLHKAGCALAGYAGAERIGCKRCMIVTDADLFPPGTITFNGIKTFGEEMSKAVSYAATLTRASGCGLQRLFDNLLVSEGVRAESVTDFSFYEEGGFSGNIRGETVILGTASFMRKMEVQMPPGLNLRTGIFLAVDRQLTAVFAVKYKPSENVEWALRIMRRSHITPILASRDPNVTPALLKRKFGVKIKMEYPDLSTRLALSEQEGGKGLPRALLFREGLLPYAETVAGARRLCRAVRRGTAIALLGSMAGILLTFYLTFLGSYSLMPPLLLLVFLLLWTLPIFLLNDWAGRY